LANTESWYILARRYRRRKIHIAYDPRSVNNIYFIDESDRQTRECILLEKDNKYKDLDWDEIKDLAKRNKEFAKNNMHRELQSEAEFFASIEATVNPAQKEKEGLTKGINKSARRKDIRSNRRDERRSERRLAGHQTDDKIDVSSTENNNTDENDEEYIPPPSYSDELLRNYMERFGNEQD
jgi:hypothetical protein